jgi:thiol-disulfide isomerase/thioredoxin
MRPSLILFIILVVLLGVGAWTVSQRTKGLTVNLSNPFTLTSTEPTGSSGLPVLRDAMPEFTGITAWIGSSPLTAAQLKGKVVLIDFWTYSCINCIRTLPYVTSWQEKYKDMGFTVIGVHTPEFAFEKVEANVRKSMDRFNVTYPVALDNSYGTWEAYNNQFWPAEYLFDAQGRLRHKHFGEGKYDETETDIQALLKEAGHDASMAMTSATSTIEYGRIESPESYLGYTRLKDLGSPEQVASDAYGRYSLVKNPGLNRVYFGGTWTVEAERALPLAGAKLVYRYSANDANLVLSNEKPEGPALRVEVTLDGAAVPEPLRGADINVDEAGKTYLLVKDQRLYQITDAKGKYGEHLLQLEFDEPGLAAYAFTFG